MKKNKKKEIKRKIFVRENFACAAYFEEAIATKVYEYKWRFRGCTVIVIRNKKRTRATIIAYEEQPITIEKALDMLMEQEKDIYWWTWISCGTIIKVAFANEKFSIEKEKYPFPGCGKKTENLGMITELSKEDVLDKLFELKEKDGYILPKTDLPL